MPYIALVHTHVTLVVLYLLLFAIKLVLLLFDKHAALANFRRKTKVIGEMVLPTLFLITGIVMVVQAPYIAQQQWFIVKMILLVTGIVLGIITFKRNNKALGIITLLVFVYMYGISETRSPVMKKDVKVYADELDKSLNEAETTDPVQLGALVYEKMRCAQCHGDEGDKGIAGAKNLKTSTLDDASLYTIISEGKNNMQPYKKALKEEEISAVAAYVKTLRK